MLKNELHKSILQGDYVGAEHKRALMEAIADCLEERILEDCDPEIKTRLIAFEIIQLVKIPTGTPQEQNVFLCNAFAIWHEREHTLAHLKPFLKQKKNER